MAWRFFTVSIHLLPLQRLEVGVDSEIEAGSESFIDQDWSLQPLCGGVAFVCGTPLSGVESGWLNCHAPFVRFPPVWTLCFRAAKDQSSLYHSWSTEHFVSQSSTKVVDRFNEANTCGL